MAAAGLGRLRRPAFDARATTELARFGLPFFPATRYALAPSALLTILNDVIINNRRAVLELGSGYSSVYIAKALGEHGRVVTVDADAGWLDQVMDSADRAGVAGRITAVHAPPRVNGSDARPWYDAEKILATIDDAPIDLLLVDGPVASSKATARARAPAVPLLKGRLAGRCSIYLDDIHRPSHAAIARDWGGELGLRFAFHHARGGYALAMRGDGFDPVM